MNSPGTGSNQILVICTANIIRSALAKAILIEKLRHENLTEGWVVDSAGVYGLPNQPAHPFALRAAAEHGLDLSQHISKKVSEELVKDSALVLTMERNHKEALQVAFPDSARKIYMLTEMIDRKYDVSDPILGTQADFQLTYDQLERLITKGLPKIVALLQSNA